MTNDLWMYMNVQEIYAMEQMTFSLRHETKNVKYVWILYLGVKWLLSIVFIYFYFILFSFGHLCQILI